jgi:DNA helicase-2/ATP-dependent DNA helicase PcrA
VANAVGDPNQSIFGFAHKVSKYLEALETSPGFKAFKLMDNFRCSTPIVNYSNRLLDANCEITETEEDGVELITVNGDETSVAEYLTNIIGDDCENWDVKDLSQVAILVKNKTTQTYIDNNLEIPHRVVASTPLDDDVNPRSRLYALLLMFYFDRNMPFMAVLDEYADYDLFTNTVKQKLLSLRDRIRAVDLLDIADEFPPLFRNVAEIILPKYQEGSSLNHLRTVLEDEKLTGTYKPLKENEVVIMTLHKAKGLEFDIVYHLNMNEWELPVKQPRDGDWNDLYCPQYDQDLNLHFVGVTRARKLCALITSTLRHNSYDQAKKSSPSEFLYLNGVEEMRKNYSY